MATVLITHEVTEVQHWRESPLRAPAFASVGFTVKTFVDPPVDTGVRAGTIATNVGR